MADSLIVSQVKLRMEDRIKWLHIRSDVRHFRQKTNIQALRGDKKTCVVGERRRCVII
jgi:hypothetical protein